MRIAIVWAFFLLAAIAAATACGGEEETKPAVTALPEGFPEDFPLYAKVTITAATVTPEGDRFVVSMETEDSADKVRAFYEEELDEEPWQVENVQDIPEMETTIIEFARGDGPGQSGTVAISVAHVNGERTSIGLQLAVAP